ncbi:MAG: flippase-like domain-containing protein [Myxococcales bacterium]|nr:flippase-like domain-containing protein [Myxococcales bacterium]
MNRFIRRALIGVVLGIVLYVAWVLWSDTARVAEAVRGYSWSAVLIALGLSSVNYLLRFAKWELCLSWLDVRGDGPGDAPQLTVTRSLLIYVAGLSMSVTPGKIGEVLRSWLLRTTDGVQFTRTAPVVIADRLTDFIALVLLSLVGISEFQEYLPVVYVSIALVVIGVIILGSPRLCHAILGALSRLPGIGRVAGAITRLIDSSATLMRLRYLAVLSALSVVGWGLECLGYYVILHGFLGVDASLTLCTFLWSVTTLIGALSFLPGGLGATEGSLALLIARLGVGVSSEIALASTVLIRGCTLWYGELVGALALVLVVRSRAYAAGEARAAEEARASEGPGASSARGE